MGSHTTFNLMCNECNRILKFLVSKFKVIIKYLCVWLKWNKIIIVVQSSFSWYLKLTTFSNGNKAPLNGHFILNSDDNIWKYALGVFICI